MDDLVCDTGFVLTQTTIFFKASGEPEVERTDLFLYPTLQPLSADLIAVKIKTMKQAL